MSSWTTPSPDRREPGATSSAPPPAQVPRPAADHHLHLPAGAHVADRRGLTAAGAVTLALVLGLLGAFIDVNTGVGLGTAFAVLFVAGSGLGALLAHREDVLATVVAPPLTYCVLALIGAAIGHTEAAGSFVTQQALELVSALILGAPTLYAATGLALVVALVRRTRTPTRSLTQTDTD